MFWSSEDLEQLQGTTVIEKIGKEQAENDYLDKVVPLLKNRTELFGDKCPNPHFSLEAYHINGSRILSRSFQVEPPSANNTDSSQTPSHEDAEMSVNEPSPQALNKSSLDETEDDEDSDDSDDDDDNPANVAMVPLADMLNARYGCENAKLFYEEHHLRMVTTRSVRQGEQIWNTYGDPPNSDLLRRYGHVDQVPLANGDLGNPADVVEIRADLVVSSVEGKYPEQAGPASSERIDWWLEEDGDDTFVAVFSDELPEEMTSFVHLLMMSEPDWAKTKHKSKLPKPKVNNAVLSVLADVVRRRLAEYPSTMEDDEALLGTEKETPIPLNLKNAVVVRLGEKRILRNLLRAVTTQLEGGDPSGSESNVRSRKRKADGRNDDGGRAVKR